MEQTLILLMKLTANQLHLDKSIKMTGLEELSPDLFSLIKSYQRVSALN